MICLQTLARNKESLQSEVSKFLSTPGVSGKLSAENTIGFYLERLRDLLLRDADIADAVQIISRDLEKLMQTLGKAEK